MATTMTRGQTTHRDLNKNGRLDPYEDPRRPVEERVEDLLGQMTLAEKAGMLFQPICPLNIPMPGRVSTEEMIAAHGLTHCNVLGTAAPRAFAEWTNRLQAVAPGERGWAFR